MRLVACACVFACVQCKRTVVRVCWWALVARADFSCTCMWIHSAKMSCCVVYFARLNINTAHSMSRTESQIHVHALFTDTCTRVHSNGTVRQTENNYATRENCGKIEFENNLLTLKLIVSMNVLKMARSLNGLVASRIQRLVELYRPYIGGQREKKIVYV